MAKSPLNRVRVGGPLDAVEDEPMYVADGGTAEERLTRAIDRFTDRMSRTIEAAERPSDGAAGDAGRLAEMAELRRGLRDMVDQLREAECERDALWAENDRLRGDIANLKQAVAHTHLIHEHARAMEATRGWKMLVKLRRLRFWR